MLSLLKPFISVMSELLSCTLFHYCPCCDIVSVSSLSYFSHRTEVIIWYQYTLKQLKHVHSRLIGITVHAVTDNNL